MPLFNVGFVIFPDVTQLDFTGPLQVLSALPQSTTHIVAKSEAPVTTDCPALILVPTHTFANCPQLDLICIAGGSQGVATAMLDRDTIAFVGRWHEADLDSAAVGGRADTRRLKFPRLIDE